MRAILATFSRRSAYLLLTVLLPLAACDDDQDPPKPVPPPVTPPPVTPTRTHNHLTLEFQHNGPDGETPLRLSTIYRSATGYDYRLSQLTYYVSNIKLTRADGTVWTEPESYHLLQVAGAPADNPTIVLDSVPVGNYTAVSFGIGVDAVRNHTGDQSGALSPNNGMIWNWATGYKFWVMEGDVWPAVNDRKDLTLHIGFDPNYRTQTLAMPSPATVTDSIAPEAHLFVRVDDVFGNPAQPATVLDITDPAQRTVMGNSAAAGVVATNLSRLFRVHHVHNEKE